LGLFLNFLNKTDFDFKLIQSSKKTSTKLDFVWCDFRRVQKVLLNRLRLLVKLTAVKTSITYGLLYFLLENQTLISKTWQPTYVIYALPKLFNQTFQRLLWTTRRFDLIDEKLTICLFNQPMFWLKQQKV